MIVASEKERADMTVGAPGAVNVFKKTLVGPPEGWTGWVMRLFTLTGDGRTPRHTHPWPHINYVVQGKGVLYLNGEEHPVEAGTYAFIPDNAEHQFINRDEREVFRFICIVPEEGDK